MVSSGKREKVGKGRNNKNGGPKPNFHTKIKKKKKANKSKSKLVNANNEKKKKSGTGSSNLQAITIPIDSSKELNFFLHHYQSANSIQLSSLELHSFSDACIVKLSESLVQDATTLAQHMMASFGASWKQHLQLPQPNSQPGSPVLLTISLSALRSLQLLRGLRSLTEECHAAKLFSKHMKVEEQVSVLKNHVNIACGTPSRIKKLIDMEALGLSRLAVVVLDMQPDVKGYSLFTLPQVRDEFWDLYKSYLHPRVLVGNLRVCLYGTIPDTCQSRKMDE